MKDLKVVFMGTPEFSVPVLKMLIENTNVIAVVTQPDKEVGRKKVLTFSPVKEVALENNIRVLQPVKLRLEYQDIIDLNPDIIITCAYGQILPFELLDYPKYKTINVHASLLPKYRGGAPIERAIMNGDKTTGITIMRTDQGMDSGDIIKKREITIDENDDIDTLSLKLSDDGSSLLLEVLPSILDGTCVYEKQNEDDVTFAYVIKREDEKIDLNSSAVDVYNKIRALKKTGAYITSKDGDIKIFKAKYNMDNNGEVGTVSNIYKDSFGIYCKSGEIIIGELQLSGKKRVLCKDYLNGINKNNFKNQKFI